MMLSYTFNSLAFDIVDSVTFYDICHQVWEDLQNQFPQSHAP